MSETQDKTRKRPTLSVDTIASATFTLVVVEGPDLGRSFQLDASLPSRVLLGQSASCEIRLQDPHVSRRQAALELVDQKLRISDLRSTNGTAVDGVEIIEANLRGGEIVRVGSTAMRVDRGLSASAPQPTRTTFGRVLGESAEMRRLYPLCERLSASDVPVVIEGETGTGKEVLAESLHENGPRANGPFIVFDCTAIPPSLLESELFGHEKGSFTGAVATRKGVFEQAHGGTLLIDEIGDLDLALQPKLLRALERSDVRRVGGDHWIRTDVRVLAATRRDLDHEVQAGRFRDDLFHRIAVTRIELPPLRRRRGDVRRLARHFAEHLGGDERTLGYDLLAQWEEYEWPGNVRELRNAVARRIALGQLPTTPDDSSEEETGGPESGRVIGDALALDLPLVAARQKLVADFERLYVERLLAKHGGNVTRAANASGVALRHFQRLRARGRQ